MDKEINNYQLVHLVAKLARDKKRNDMDGSNFKQNNYIKTINESKDRRNYVLEAINELVDDKKVDDKQ